MSPTNLTFSLTGKVALVTGSSRGIGAAIVKYLADQGADVAVNYARNSNAGEDLAKEINSKGKGKAVAIQGDASTVAAGHKLVDNTIKAFGKLDILVLNAGLLKLNPVYAATEKDFDEHINVNVKTPLFTALKAAQLMTEGGRIIFVSSSLTSSSNVQPLYLNYLASKGAVEQVSRTLAKDLAPKGITVNTISPGSVETPLFLEGKTPQMIEAIAKQSPVGRVGQPDEIAPVVSFLASPAAQWVNGQNIRVNGGLVV